jgi:hypothetical protein
VDVGDLRDAIAVELDGKPVDLDLELDEARPAARGDETAECRERERDRARMRRRRVEQRRDQPGDRPKQTVDRRGRPPGEKRHEQAITKPRWLRGIREALTELRVDERRRQRGRDEVGQRAQGERAAEPTRYQHERRELHHGHEEQDDGDDAMRSATCARHYAKEHA